MAYQQGLLVNELYLRAQSSISPNLFSASIPIYALILSSLISVAEARDRAEEESAVERAIPVNDRSSYDMRVSIGELCNTSVYDDSSGRALEDLVKRVLGERAAARFSELRRIKPGWDFGKGEALSDGAVRNLTALLSRVKSAPSNVRLFLSSDGSLEIQWRSRDGNRISVFAKDDRFELFQPEQDEEKTFSDSDFQGVLLAAGII